MKILFTLLLVLLELLGRSQVVGEMRSIGSLTNTSYQKNNQQVFACANMIASSALAVKPMVGMYLENRFATKGLSNMRFAYFLPKNKGGFAFAGYLAGTGPMNTVGISAGHGIRLTEQLGVGLKIETVMASWNQGEKYVRVGYQTGMIYQVSEKTSCGIHFGNHRFIKSAKENKLSGYYSLHAGIGHQLNSSIFIACELLKETNKQVSLSPSMIWSIGEIIQIQAGLTPPLNTGNVGMGWRFKKDLFLVSFSSHLSLGFSGAITLTHEL
jgi:hypothetical protein